MRIYVFDLDEAPLSIYTASEAPGVGDHVVTDNGKGVVAYREWHPNDDGGVDCRVFVQRVK